MRNNRFCIVALLLVFSSCSLEKKISRQADKTIFQNKDLATAHIGISVYDPEKASYLYNFQGDKYFVPASNTKLITCYAAMKYLGDSIAGARLTWNGSELNVYPTGDPGFLHPDFPHEKLLALMQSPATQSIRLFMPKTGFKPFGRGWTWDDYQASYMPARSVMPLFGNIVQFEKKKEGLKVTPAVPEFIPAENITTTGMRVQRDMDANRFHVYNNRDSSAKRDEIPFRPTGFEGIAALVVEKAILGTMLGNKTIQLDSGMAPATAGWLYVRHTDSLLKPMMHRSDNFFAEQSLLMVSNIKLGYMDDRKMIDTLLKTDLTDLPQKPSWVDGSGLSRYNLFTPQDFVTVLRKMKDEFAWNRITTILPTGGTGTLGSLYKNLQGKIFAKTGTLSGQVALSGYLITKKQKTLIFSVLVNNHQTAALTVRKAVEQFLEQLYNNN